MDVLREALAPVLRDVEATTDVSLRIDEGGWSTELGPTAMIRTDHGDTGVYVRLADSESERVIAATEAVQEVVIEELWARASNWPMCPAHRSSHPMDARSVSEQAWWVCPADGALVAQVGTLRL